MTQIIDGKKIAADMLEELKLTIDGFRLTNYRAPNLTVVLVGDDPASKIYVSHKEKACLKVGIRSETVRLPASSSEQEVLSLIDKLNMDSGVDAILVQLPLPKQIDKMKVIQQIAPYKDVDGLGPLNQGFLTLNLPGLVPCTPLGVMELLRASGCDPAGKHAVVVGRSVLVGGPIVRLLTHANATVTNIHSRTPNPQDLARQADILVVAAGVHHLVDEHWVKKGATVIDVGIHRVQDKLEGDVNFTRVGAVAGAITPVPGGVGPMTIACLMSNCVKAFEWGRQLGVTAGTEGQEN